MVTDALDEKGQRKESRLLSGLGLRAREGIYGPDIAPRLAEILNTVDIIESIDGDLLKIFIKRVLKTALKDDWQNKRKGRQKGEQLSYRLYRMILFL